MTTGTTNADLKVHLLIYYYTLAASQRYIILPTENVSADYICNDSRSAIQIYSLNLSAKIKLMLWKYNISTN